MTRVQGEILKFIKTKEYTFQRYLGQGGTGTAILVKDEVTEFNFVCKKYTPYDEEKKEEYFKRFIDEIKIMIPVFHENIVRIYNYYLYPEHTTGYILMEYIEGSTIDEFLLWQSNDIFEDIFIQLIDAFAYLEKNNILHRDIRNNNILVTDDGVLKVIDFGFGKKIGETNKETASILLNWPVSEFPEEIQEQKYNHQTEVYFVGKLFNKLMESNGVVDFSYRHIIEKMILTNPDKRVSSFFEVRESISQDIFKEYNFTEKEQQIYIAFADQLRYHVNSFSSELKPVKNVKAILKSLESLLKECLLEEYLQNNASLISCFVENGYNYKPKKDIYVSDISDFYKMLFRFSQSKQEIVLNNIIARLRTITVVVPNTEDDEIPF